MINGFDIAKRVQSEIRSGAKQVTVTQEEWEGLCRFHDEEPNNPDPYYHLHTWTGLLTAKVIVK